MINEQTTTGITNHIFKFTINDQFSFDSLKELQEFMIDNSNTYADNSEFLNIKIDILSPYEDYSFFNLNIYESDIDEISNLRLPTDNNIFLVCNNVYKKENLEHSLNILKESYQVNNENVLIVLTKPDRLDNFKNIQELQINTKDFTTCYVRMRTEEERNLFPKAIEFNDRELKFYEGKSLLKNEFLKHGVDYIDNFIFNSFIKFVSN